MEIVLKECDMSKPYVFVSYSKKDREIVYPIIRRLQEEGYNIWIDKMLEQLVGEEWQNGALSAIANPDDLCKAILFFMSENSLTSAPVCAELLWSSNEATMRYNNEEALKIIPINISSEWKMRTGNISEWLMELMKNAKDDLKDSDIEVLRTVEVDEKLLKGLQRYKKTSDIVRHIQNEVFGGKSKIDKITFADGEGTETIMRNIPKEVKNQGDVDGASFPETLEVDEKENYDEITAAPVEQQPTQWPVECPGKYSYSLKEMIEKGSVDSIQTKYVPMISAYFKEHPEWNISEQKKTSLLLKEFVKRQIELQGEKYITDVNDKNPKASKHPVFIKSDDIKNHGGISYWKIEPGHAEWAMNVQYSAYEFVRQFGNRVQELGVDLEDVQIVVDKELNFEQKKDNVSVTVKPIEFKENITLEKIRNAFDQEEIARKFRAVREGMPRGGKGAMDYAMAAILGGCNQIKATSPEYQINYYCYDIATPDKNADSDKKDLGATWTWSSNCRKVLGLEKSGQIPDDINEAFHNLSKDLTIRELCDRFMDGKVAEYQTVKNDLVIEALKQIQAFFTE